MTQVYFALSAPSEHQIVTAAPKRPQPSHQFVQNASKGPNICPFFHVVLVVDALRSHVLRSADEVGMTQALFQLLFNLFDVLA